MLHIKPVTTLSVAISTALIMACAPTQEAKNNTEPFKLPIPVATQSADKDVKEDIQIGSLPQSQTRSANKTEADALAQQGYLQKQGKAKYIAEESKMMAARAYNTGVTMPLMRLASEPLDRENYVHFDDNGIKLAAESPVSTFSIDVDTGAYSNVRRMLNEGRLPREDAVRVEEMINYFSYNYPAPANSATPFRVSTEVGPSPWNNNSHLIHIGIKGFNNTNKELPPSNLVFLIDVSGSMNSANKLGLLKSSLKLLTSKLREQDRISLVVYAGASGVVLEPVKGTEKAKILTAMNSLSAGGSTNGAAGIRLAYQMAEQSFIKGGINRILLATDGDFNVGTVNFEALKDLIEEKRKTGISLTTLGFGRGNYNDHMMEQLADAGNGNYAYIDTLNEAQKVLVDEIGSTLNTIAKDVKIQVEFNPSVVSEYRLIGYENRALNREDFNNDKIDAGEIGAGHTVTALYEVTFTDSQTHRIDPLRYGSEKSGATRHSNEIALLRLRYKQPDGNVSKLIETPIKISSAIEKLGNTSEYYRFSAAVAGFGQLLRGGKHTENLNYTDVLELARNARGKDAFGYRGEFISMVNLAQSLASTSTQASR